MTSSVISLENAVPPMVSIITRRADFVSASKSGFKFVKPAVVVQLRARLASECGASHVRVGFTATKTLGNAVIRNRVKRRLRQAARQLIPVYGLPGCDYVFIGRQQAFMGPFDSLILDMKHALKRLADMMRAQSAPAKQKVKTDETAATHGDARPRHV